MDLSTTYLGFRLSHPLIPGASPLVADLDTIRLLEDAGAPAIVMPSLFEEQIEDEQLCEHASPGPVAELPDGRGDTLSVPESYLEQVRRTKDAIDVPLIASLNGTSEGGWLEYAALLEEAGADAIELNVYELATDPWVSGSEVEDRTVRIVREVKRRAQIPLAVKVCAFYTSFANFAQQLDDAGADGLVLFNRFYQPEIDADLLELRHAVQFSDSSELLLRLRWLAVLSGEVEASLAATGGVHEALDAAKAILCGAHAVQVVSVLFKRGPGYLATLTQELANWMVRHEYESFKDLHAAMSLERCTDPHAHERAHYIETLSNWWRSLLSV